MSSEQDTYTQKLLDRARARNEALQQKMQEHAFQSRKRRPLETQENTMDNLTDTGTMNKERELDKTLVRSESPNKRSRLEKQSLSLSKEPSSIKATASTTEQGGKSISERMQKILNQRKQWDAAEHGDDVDFENIPSPVHHGPKSPLTTLPPRSRVDIERKARLAAFAQEFNNREDDTSHYSMTSGVVDESLSTQEKPTTAETGRKTPMSDVYRCETLCTAADDVVRDSPKKDGARPTRAVSQRVSLSIETLANFANKGRDAAPAAVNSSPAKPTIQKKLASDRISVGTFLKENCAVDRHQVTPTAKTLQQRLVELQKNGCNAEQSAAANDKPVQGSEELPQPEVEEKFENQEDADVEEKAEELIDESEIIDESSNISMGIATESDNLQDASTFERDQPVISANTTGRSKSDVGSDESGLSFNDSMMDELEANQVLSGRRSTAVQCELSFCSDAGNGETIASIQSNLHQLSDCSRNDDQEEIDVDEVEEDDQMIDDLFDGVTCINDDEDASFTTDISVRSKPTLTRQKSRLEIKTELTMRKQTCNEAEDTHVIRRNPSRHLRPLARSTSSESVVSLGAEKSAPEQIVPVYTIDSYRMEKRKSIRNIDKKVVRKENVKAPGNDVVRRSRVSSLKERNTCLLEEVQQQQRVIQQASAALNCCYDVHHGKGSITELEAEKLLLIASEKRQALLAEIQKLKARSESDEESAHEPCRGTLTIENIHLPLRTEYIFSMASKKDGGDSLNHYYFILVRNGAHKILATHLASTHDSLSADALVFKDKFSFDGLESDFEICIEVYSVHHRNRAFAVPNQEKSKKKISELLHKSLTPRKLKARSIHGSVPASPGGPNAIRISSFTPIGSVTIGLDDVKKNKFVLQKVPFLSPITGQLACKVSTNFHSATEQRGFLTMFDDVGGLGAWHRRWCVLRNGVLYSWTYPDDEKHKDALSTLEMRQCISRDVRTVERIMCARPNTFELRTMRPRRQGDKQNLISQDTGSVITTRHWLAADTKDERLLWIESLNQALIDERAWNPSSLKPLC